MNMENFAGSYLSKSAGIRRAAFYEANLRKIADCSMGALALDLPSQFLEVRWLVQSS